jgi:hypothetical protein
MFPKPILFLFCAILLTSCFDRRPRSSFDPSRTPPPPNYQDKANWAAHPDFADMADSVPCTKAEDLQRLADVDVFFLYPTTYTGTKPGEKQWNAAPDDIALNKKTEQSTILYQSTIFNGVARVFAPRYRQAHLYSFFTKDSLSAEQALDVAYADVLAAFDYYIEYENKGRPFILAGHSQGARHGMYLLRDRIEQTNLANRLVVAYLAGWPVKQDFFKKTPPCQRPEQTGCFCSWRTWKREYGLKHAFEEDVVCTNPINWSIEEGLYAPKSENKGAVLRSFCDVYTQICDAEVYKGILLCTKPSFPGSALFIRNNYHIGDMNLYYMDIRANAKTRVDAFWKN